MQKIIVQNNNSGNRIDKFLKKEVFLDMDITRGEIIRNIRLGKILVNGNKTKPSYILKKNDEIKIDFPEKTNPELVPDEKVAFGIIHQDENIIVVDKPAGLQIHPSFKKENDTLANGLICRFPELKKVGDNPGLRPGIVHRLDRDTSGVLVAARNQKTFLALKNEFKNRRIKKIYWAIVHGNFEKEAKSGTIDMPIARAADYKKQIIANVKTRTKIRSAVTEYKVIEEFEKYSLVEASPKTGRMHQIRVHMNHIGHPVVADAMYGTKKIQSGNAKRHLLHAKEIEFELFGKNFRFESEIPEDFRSFLDEIEK